MFNLVPVCAANQQLNCFSKYKSENGVILSTLIPEFLIEN